MPTRDQTPSGSLRAKRHSGRLFTASVAAVVIVLSIIIGLEVSAAALRPTPASPEQWSDQIVNRARKSDRQIGLQELQKIRPRLTPAPDLKLAVGCESLVSPMENAQWAKVARRCVT